MKKGTGDWGLGTRGWGLGTGDWGPGTGGRGSQSARVGKQPLIQVIIIVIAVLFFAAPMAEAQSGPGPAKTETPYLLPQTIFVGDSGRLVVPLGQAFSGTEPFVLDTPGSLPGTPQLVIRRIELERRNTGSR
ncbi:MAG: hypothetical protein FWC45_00570, partial [Treponema sp.]|nr:hypothetical protein [Treponema sp.]